MTDQRERGDLRSALPPALLERALGAAGEGIVIADARLPDMPLIFVNAAFEGVTGYTRAEALGRNCRFLQGPGSDPAALAAIRTALAERRGVVVELLNYRKDGTPFWNRLSITPVFDEAGEVTHFIGVQSDVTERRLAQERLEAANRQMRRDLEAAARIQMSLLPAVPPRLPGARVAWTFRPCKELAGDMLNVFAMDTDTVVFFVLDVSGHGVGAALLSFTLAHTLAAVPGQSCLLRAAGENWFPAPPAQVAAELNRRFPLDPAAPQFFTLFYGLLTPSSGRVRYVSAGHPLALVAPAEGVARRLAATGPPVGVSEAASYTEGTLELRAGDRLVVFTDGLTEALSPGGEELGFERVVQVVTGAAGRRVEQLVEALAEAGVRWAGGAPHDDISVLVLEGCASPGGER